MNKKFITLFIIFFIFENNKASEILTKKEYEKNRRAKRRYDPQYAVQDHVVNPHPFEYIYNPEFSICKPSDTIDILTYVHTSPGNYKRRLTLRETWARRAMFKNTRIVFMMGKTEEKEIVEMLKLEASIYNDIVQEDYHDSYRNLTYKGVQAMKWISEYCPQAKFILKVDDDMFVNMFAISRHLNSFHKYKAFDKNTIICHAYQDFSMPVMRDKKSRWYVSEEMYGPPVYSGYCSGSSFILTGDMPKPMWEKSKYIKFFWVDDFWITGLLADACNATRKQISSIYKLYSRTGVENDIHQQIETKLMGHLPVKGLKSIQNLWKHVLEDQFKRYINLNKIDASLVGTDDFFNSEDFKWTMDIWKPFYEQSIYPVEDYFKLDTF